MILARRKPLAALTAVAAALAFAVPTASAGAATTLPAPTAVGAPAPGFGFGFGFQNMTCPILQNLLQNSTNAGLTTVFQFQVSSFCGTGLFGL
jgi:hypothetical protein